MFAKTIAALSLLAALLCPEARANVRPLVHRSDAADNGVHVKPEYARALRRVLLAVPQRDDESRTASAASVDPRFVHAVHDELLSAIPSYSTVGVILHEDDQETVLGWKHLFDARDSIHMHIVRATKNDVDLWTQDLGEFYERNGEGRFLVSALPHPKMEPAHSIAQSRQHVATTIFGESKIDISDVVFEAGNLLFDETETGTRVIAGEDVVTRTIESARLSGKKLDASSVVERMSRQFGGAEVVILEGAQGGGLIHIDQAFVLLDNGIAVLNQIDGSSPEARLLRGYREQLEWLGYTVLTLPASVEDVRRYRASTNALPFEHLQTGARVIIYPVFPGELVQGAPTTLGKEHLTGKASAAYELFERAGYVPRPIRDVAHVSGGNTHCVANILE